MLTQWSFLTHGPLDQVRQPQHRDHPTLIEQCVGSLTSHQCGPGSIPRSGVVEFVGSLLCIERFSQGIPVSPLLKNHHLT